MNTAALASPGHRFWPVGEAAQADYEALRAQVLATGAMPDSLIAARFARRGVAGQCVTGQATADVDLPAALAAYRAAVEQARKVDNRLFLGLARTAAVELAARQASPHEALAEFERVLGEWDELCNVTVQWWVLLQISVLLTRLGFDRPAALLAGAFGAGGHRTWMLLGDDDRLQTSIAALTERLDEQTVRAVFAEGAALGFDEAAGLAQQSITAPRVREPAVSRPRP